MMASHRNSNVAYCGAEKYFGVYAPVGAAAFSLCTIWWTYSAASAGMICRTDPPTAPTASVLKMSRLLMPSFAIAIPLLGDLCVLCVEIRTSLRSRRPSVHKFFQTFNFQLLTSYRFPFLASSSRYSDARQESAMIVSVGFLSGLVTSDALSVTNRFFTSCAWQNPLSTEVFGSAPIRAVPTS